MDHIPLMTTEEFKALAVAVGAVIMGSLLALKGFLQVSKEVMDKMPAWVQSLKAFIRWIKNGCKPSV